MAGDTPFISRDKDRDISEPSFALFWTKIISENENDVELKINAHMFEKYFWVEIENIVLKINLSTQEEGITEGRQRIFLWFHSIADFELANDAQKIEKNHEWKILHVWDIL